MLYQGLMDKQRDEKSIDVKVSRTPEDYFQERIRHKIDVYSRKGDYYKIFHWVLAFISALGAAIVPALINVEGETAQTWATILSIVVAVAVACDGIFYPRQLWRNYDLISSELREEEMRYSTGTGPYAKNKLAKNEDPFAKFVGRVEDRIASERAETILTRTSAGKEERPSIISDIDDVILDHREVTK